MPVEIRELTIQVNVKKPEEHSGNAAGSNALDSKEQVQQILDEVFRIIEQKKER
jgi:hypothetical protein